MRQEADIFLAAEIMWLSRSNRRKLYPVIYAGVSGEGTVWCLFPFLEALVVLLSARSRIFWVKTLFRLVGWAMMASLTSYPS